jgi:thiol-disulfide isomerase/thioredoxin
MTSKSRESRREAARAADRSKGRSRWLLPVVGGGVVILAAVAAILLSQGSPTGGSSSAKPSGSPAGSVAPGTAPVVTGASLPAFEAVSGDTAVDQAIPTVEGAAFDGTPVVIADDGRPKVLIFLAHWCNHCQVEVPLIQGWLDGGGGPADVDLISIATGIDSTLPNYPPDEWLAREGWTVPTIVDPTGAVATAYGLTAFPFWVFVDGDGLVQARLTGELAIADLETIIGGLRNR